MKTQMKCVIMHYLIRQNQSSEKKIQYFNGKYNLWPLNIYNEPSWLDCIKLYGKFIVLKRVEAFQVKITLLFLFNTNSAVKHQKHTSNADSFSMYYLETYRHLVKRWLILTYFTNWCAGWSVSSWCLLIHHKRDREREDSLKYNGSVLLKC